MALTKIKLDTMVTGNLPDANIPNNITISNAGTATALETARTIHGVSFDGTANIDLTEAIQDVVGGMVSSNTETNIAVTYDDTNGKLDFASTDTNTFRPITAGGNSLGSSETLAFTAGSNVTITESGGAVTIASTDTNTTYSVGDGGLTQNNFTDALKSKLDGIASSANNYSLPLATSSARGGVKIGYSENGKNYPVELDSEKMYVNVPWTDTNTTYSVGDGGLTQNNFTDALKSKLDGIESGATADQDLSGYAALSGATFTGNVTHGGNITTATSTDYAVLHGIQGGLRVLSSRSSDTGILLTNNSGAFRAQLYGASGYYGFLDAHWGNWDIKKAVNGQMTLKVSGSYYDVWHSGNDGSGSGLDADLWDGNQFSSYLNQAVLTTSNPTFNQIYANDWFRVNGSDGIYWQDHGGGWQMTDSTYLRVYNSKMVYLTNGTLVSGPIRRADHVGGWLEGSYNNVAANSQYSNPIYTIGSSYNPSNSSLSNMYGIGYSHGNFWGSSNGIPQDWGLYVAADGDIRCCLDASNGIIWTTGSFKVGTNTVHHQGNLGAWQNDSRNFRFVSPSNTGGQGLMGDMNNGTFQWQLYGDGTNVGFLDGEWASWDLKKVYNGGLILYGSGDNNTQIGSGDEWGRLEFANHSNGTYVYANQGSFRVDNADWNPYDNAELDLGSDSLRWQNAYINNICKVGRLDLNNGFVWEQGSSNYGRFGSWLQGGGSHGIYYPGTSDASAPHIYPNNAYGSYGTFRVTGGNGGYPGMIMGGHSYKPTFMVADSTASGGLYYQTTGRWAYYHNYGHNCLGIGSSTTSSSYHMYVHGSVYTTGSYSSSDARLKTDVTTIENSLDKVMNMRGVYFNWIHEDRDKGRQTGVIAQEVLEVLPECVNHDDENDEYSVDYNKITAVLIESIKELKQEINELKGN